MKAEEQLKKAYCEEHLGEGAREWILQATLQTLQTEPAAKKPTFWEKFWAAQKVLIPVCASVVVVCISIVLMLQLRTDSEKDASSEPLSRSGEYITEVTKATASEIISNNQSKGEAMDRDEQNSVGILSPAPYGECVTFFTRDDGEGYIYYFIQHAELCTRYMDAIIDKLGRTGEVIYITDIEIRDRRLYVSGFGEPAVAQSLSEDVQFQFGEGSKTADMPIYSAEFELDEEGNIME